MTFAARALLQPALLLAGLLSSAIAYADSSAGGTATATGGLSYHLNGSYAGLPTTTAVGLPVYFGGNLGLLPHGQEFLLSATPSTTRMPEWMVSMLPGSGYGVGFDSTRAIYRYTFLESDTWAWKVGLSTGLADSQTIAARQALGLSTEGSRLGLTPSMHFSGTGHLGDRWQLSLDADATGRGRQLDLDLRVNYGLGGDMFLYGGYRLESGADVDDLYGLTPANTANFGFQLRF